MISFSFISDDSCPGVFLRGQKRSRKEGGEPFIKCTYNPTLVKTQSLVEFLSLFKDPLAQQTRFTEDKEAKRILDLLCPLPDQDQDRGLPHHLRPWPRCGKAWRSLFDPISRIRRKTALPLLLGCRSRGCGKNAGGC